MSLSAFVESLERSKEQYGPMPKRVWKVVAFLGRYGMQPANVSLSLPVDDLMQLAEQVGELIDRENEGNKKA